MDRLKFFSSRVARSTSPSHSIGPFVMNTRAELEQAFPTIAARNLAGGRFLRALRCIHAEQRPVREGMPTDESNMPRHDRVRRLTGCVASGFSRKINAGGSLPPEGGSHSVPA